MLLSSERFVMTLLQTRSKTDKNPDRFIVLLVRHEDSRLLPIDTPYLYAPFHS